MSLVDTCTNYRGSRRHATIKAYSGYDGVSIDGDVYFFNTARLQVDKYLEGVILLDIVSRPDDPPALIIAYQPSARIPGGFTFTVVNVGDDITFSIFAEDIDNNLVIPDQLPPTKFFDQGRWQLYGGDRARFVALYDEEDVLHWVRTPFSGEGQA